MTFSRGIFILQGLCLCREACRAGLSRRNHFPLLPAKPGTPSDASSERLLKPLSPHELLAEKDEWIQSWYWPHSQHCAYTIPVPEKGEIILVLTKTNFYVYISYMFLKLPGENTIQKIASSTEMILIFNNVHLNFFM